MAWGEARRGACAVPAPASAGSPAARRRFRGGGREQHRGRSPGAFGPIERRVGRRHPARPVATRTPNRRRSRAAPGRIPAAATRPRASGRASPTMTSAAASMRSASSHHGVRAGVSAVAFNPSSSRTAGKISWRGEGGVTRSSHHSSGRATQGEQQPGRGEDHLRPGLRRQGGVESRAGPPRADGRCDGR